MAQEWWRQTIVYQIYPKSFQDSNDDGIGDIPGIIRRLDYLSELGVETLWLNPIFISPQIDNGYDVSNYYAVDSLFGTMADVEMLIAGAHQRGMKVMFDFVLNHTSREHPWFQEALKGPDNIYRDYYLWHPGSQDSGLPNNWESFFGGSVWEKDEASGEYYFHLFDKEMPDLNWHNPEVRKAMLDIAAFWIEKGIDGLRLDAFIHIIKDDFNKQLPGLAQGELALAEEYYANLPGVLDYLSEFIGGVKAIKPDLFILGEAASATPELGSRYTQPENNLCSSVISFNYFKFAESSADGLKDPQAVQLFKQTMMDWQKTLSADQLPALYWNNHDMARLVSRFGDDTVYRDRSATMLAALMYLQCGIPVLLYGEEIGMKNLVLSDVDKLQDKRALEQKRRLLSEGCSEAEAMHLVVSQHKEASRGAMQWDDSEFAGFSNVAPWLGVNQESRYNVAAESAAADSVLHFYRSLLALKRRPLFTEGSIEFLATADTLFGYTRSWQDERAVILCNLTAEEQSVAPWLPADPEYNEILANFDFSGNVHRLPPYGVVVIVYED
ncbi:alpha-glucosidase [Vagococcus acidifermentans]|uniref:Alpha-glucosidase n=1 Tax=Vagococcus acidifermentans TaxID=564710 RepID=A0A430ATQ1_9ENTE|nr:alpha-glucosidase [Vagococcus acidifermentans]RSU11444.1 alpha-glucosidase [Vagococcus acidifermentans]